MICTKFDWNWPAGSGDFFQYKHVNMGFPIVAPPDPRGPWFVQTWLYIMSESFHVNMSSSGSVVCEKSFKCPHPIFVIISPLKRTCPLICTILNALYLRMICTKFYWNWLAGSGEDIFHYKHIEIWFSLLWPLPTPEDHGLYKLKSTSYQKAFM
jgi:hypothetical protein